MTDPRPPIPAATSRAGQAIDPRQVEDRITDALAAVPDVRLYTPPPFDTLPRLPGRPPAGLTLAPGELTVHLAVATLPIPELLRRVEATIRAALAGTSWSTAHLRLHVDELDGDPFDDPPGTGEAG